MSFLSFFRRPAGAIVVAFAGLVLTACSAEMVDQGGGGPRPRPQRVCTAEYLPVCAARGGEQQTFANACEARSSGFRVLGQGECRHGRPEQRPSACTREYAPVCGTRGGERQTFANACEARSSGYDIAGRGECQITRPDRDRGDWREGDRTPRERPNRDDRARNDRQRPSACTMEYMPVCAMRGNTRQTFGNSCSAEIEGFRVVSRGACR